MSITSHVAGPLGPDRIQRCIAELTYRSYREQRRLSPSISPERWVAIYPQVEQLEARYQSDTEWFPGTSGTHFAGQPLKKERA